MQETVCEIAAVVLSVVTAAQSRRDTLLVGQELGDRETECAALSATLLCLNPKTCLLPVPILGQAVGDGVISERGATRPQFYHFPRKG